MASTACFLHHHAPSTASRTPSLRQAPALRTSQLVVKAQRQEDDGSGAVSRRLAITILVGAAAVGTKVSPADAAYGEAGNMLI